MDGSYDAYEYTMSIKDLSKIHTAAALVSVMGSESDKGNYDKYMKRISHSHLWKKDGKDMIKKMRTRPWLMH